MRQVMKIDRSGIFDRFSEDELRARYRRNYGITEVSIGQVRHHAELEGELTDTILASSPEERSRVAADAYSRLYREIDWLVGTGGPDDAAVWLSLLHPGASVYEIGSGSGHLARYLNDNGVHCIRTDISAERNAVGGADGIATTDGVHLSAFVDTTYDFAISDQMVEHLHPDDIVDHFRECRKILKPGGCYLARMPNRHLGPCDLSRVFGTDEAIFLHLHEFTWADVRAIERTCGYRKVEAVFKIPKTRRFVRSAWYYRYLCLVEPLIRRSRNRAKLARLLYYPSQVWVALTA